MNERTPPLTYLITPGSLTRANYPSSSPLLLATVATGVRDGLSHIQLREKQLPGRLLFELARSAASLVKGSATRLLVNDRADIAAAVGAGVHLAETSIPCAAVRSSFPDLFIGVSVHSVNGARSAEREGADLCVFGPVFPTPGKPAGTGTEALREVCTAVKGIRVLALGGIDESNLEEVLSTGCAGIAAIRVLYDPDRRRAILDRILREPRAYGN